MKNKNSLRALAALIIVMVSSLGMLSARDTLRHVTLRNGDIEMSVINYGARIVSLKPYGTDVVLGYDRLADYCLTKQNFGAVIGRYIGRILRGHLEIDGETYQLPLQPSGDCGHGGDPNFGRHFWRILPESVADSAMTLRYVSPDGENAFPGQLTLDVTYTLMDDGLRIDYRAETTRATVINVTNHSFFNLTGDLGSNVLAEEVWIDSDSIALYDPNKRVTGQMGAVAGTALDFRQPHAIGDSIDADNAQLRVTKGYDHCYQLNHYLKGDAEATLLSHPVARLTDQTSGLTMEVYTTEPALQIYTANGHKGDLIGKEGKPYIRRNAICFETMHFPDSPNQPQWPTTLLRPGETFRSTTIFRFKRNDR